MTTQDALNAIVNASVADLRKHGDYEPGDKAAIRHEVALALIGDGRERCDLDEFGWGLVNEYKPQIENLDVAWLESVIGAEV